MLGISVYIINIFELNHTIAQSEEENRKLQYFDSKKLTTYLREFKRFQNICFYYMYVYI